MKQFACSVPAILFTSAACLSLIALGGCGGSGSSSGNSSGTPSGPTAATHIYAIQHTGIAGTNEQDSVLVFSASATGSTTPTSTLTLPSGDIGVSLAVGPQGQIYVGMADPATEGGAILEYAAGASGTATPTVTLNGSSSGTSTFILPANLAVNSAGTLFVSSSNGSLEAFASGFTASSNPTQYLTWGVDNFGTSEDSAGGIISADTAGDVFYVDYINDVIDVFAAGATGAGAPTRTITGTNTNSFDELAFIAADGAGDVYVTNFNYTDLPSDSVTRPGAYGASKSLQAMWPGSASRLTARPHVPETYEPTEIIEFAAGATGNATPLKRIGDPTADTTNLTNIVEPLGIAVDAVGNLYYADAYGAADTSQVLLEVFAPSATGNVAPAASITSTNYTIWSDGPPFPVDQVAIH